MTVHSILLHNFWLKLFSIILATLIWIAVRANLASASADVNRKFPHRPVLVMSGAGEHPALTIEPGDVSVLVRGPAELIGRLKEQDVQVFLPLDDRQDLPGEFAIVVHVPPGLKEVVAFPDRVSVQRSGRP
jgi:hypothetical protein